MTVNQRAGERRTNRTEFDATLWYVHGIVLADLDAGRLVVDYQLRVQDGAMLFAANGTATSAPSPGLLQRERETPGQLMDAGTVIAGYRHPAGSTRAAPNGVRRHSRIRRYTIGAATSGRSSTGAGLADA